MSEPVLSTGSPLQPEIGVIGLVTNRWNDLWQPRHQIMRRLAAWFNVVWMNPADEWRRTLAERPRAQVRPSDDSGWQVYTAPPYLPVVHRPAVIGRALARARVQQARRLLEARGARRIVLYLWRPKFADALDVAHDLSVYHIDDEYSFAADETPPDPAELSLIERAGQVIIHSPRLMERKGGLNPHTANVPNGVDFDAFAAPGPEPDDLAVLPKPRVGYAGWLKHQLDWPLLDRLAELAPEYTFVFVGDTKHRAELERTTAFVRLRQRPNVHFLGRKSPDELARYPQHFDVCVMPYKVNPYTDCIYPLKLHEYLASGRPTIGTPIRALRDFKDVVELATSPEEWRAALEGVLRASESSPDRVSARQQVAREHDWWVLTERIAVHIADRLGTPLAPAPRSDHRWPQPAGPDPLPGSSGSGIHTT